MRSSSAWRSVSVSSGTTEERMQPSHLSPPAPCCSSMRAMRAAYSSAVRVFTVAMPQEKATAPSFTPAMVTRLLDKSTVKSIRITSRA